MSLFRRTYLSSVLALAACGFEPIYAPSSQAGELRGKIILPNAGNEEQLAFRSALLRHFGEPQNPEYRLVTTYSATISRLAITQANIETRQRLTAEVHYELVRLKDQRVILEQDIVRIAGFTVNRERFTADQVEEANRERLAVTMGDEVATRIATAFSNQDAR